MDYTILVLDDEEAVTRVLTHALSPKYRVIGTHDVSTAEYLIENLDIDLIIADYYVKDQLGIKLCAYGIPLILISGKLPNEELMDLLGEGEGCPALFLYKPFRLDDLLEAVC
jgi:DNA-binding NtrC family response regulator